MFFYNPKRKFPLLFNAIIRTGLASMEDMPPLKVIGDNAILPPYVEEMPGMKEENFRGVLIAHISIFLHNALVADDFPTDEKLKNLCLRAEKKLSRLKHNPWLIMMNKYGKKGECPSLEDLDSIYDAVEQMALSMARPEWESTVPNLIVGFVDWLVDNRKSIEAWNLNRIQLFKDA